MKGSREYPAGQKFMQLALNLAQKGLGSVEPNPVVGCVIVKDGQVIGKGFHEKFGGPHAEINALADCGNKGFDPSGATVYVTLEPCCHTGKTGPCTQALIEAKIAKVFIAALDPTEKVNGRGAAALAAAGIETNTGLCAERAQKLNAPFFKYARTGRPWVILKWAQSIDGKLAHKGRHAGQGWLSCRKSRLDAHKLRSRVQAILVGVNTVITDDPMLTIRLPKKTVDRPPFRVVLDGRLRIPPDCNLITTGDAPTLVVTAKSAAAIQAKKIETLRQHNVGLLAVSEKDGRCDIKSVLEHLGRRGVQQLLVEGGPTVLSSFLRLADECVIYIAPEILGAKGEACIGEAFKYAGRALSLKDVIIRVFDEDVRIGGLFSSDGR